MTNHPGEKNWSPEIIEEMRRLIGEGLSTGVIADKLAEKFDRLYSRNMIIGKCRRLGIKLEASPVVSIRQTPDKPKKFRWTEEVLDDLRALGKQGKDARQIAEALTIKYGVHCSQNMVVGRVHRAGGELRAAIIKTVHKRVGSRSVVTIEPKVSEEPRTYKPWGATSFPNPKARMLQFLDLKFDECRFSVGEIRNGTLRFCGAKTTEVTGSYCPECYDVVYVPTKMSPRRKAIEKMRIEHGRANQVVGG